MTGIAGLSNKNSRVRLAMGLAATTALVFAAYWSLRLAYADRLYRRNTLESLARAVELDGGNARYPAWRAELQESAGQDPAAELQRAVELNPYASDVWMRLAARAEADGDFRRAERLFLKAAQVDRLFTPRWALMNFYFRRGDAAQFWLWTRRALEMSHDDLTPVFELCWQFSQDAERIDQALPQDERVSREYLAYLMARNRWAAAQSVAAKLTKPADLPLLLSYCDRLLERNQPAVALAVWNGVCARRWLPYAPGLTNGDFAVPSIQSGFDWRIIHDPEISIVQPAPGGGVQATLSGRQPERAELLWQWAPVEPQRSYRLAFQYQTTGMSRTGVFWSVGQDSPALPPSEPWREGEFRFAAAASNVVRLALIYAREPGAMRAEGTLRLRNLRLELAR